MSSIDDIKKIKVWLTETGKDPDYKNLAIEKKIDQSDLQKAFTFDVWADFITDGKEKRKVGNVAFNYDSPPPPPPPPPIGEISVSLSATPDNPEIGQLITLDASGSKPSSTNAYITSWQWTARNDFGLEYPVSSSGQPSAGLKAPPIQRIIIDLTLKDSNGKTASKSKVINIKQPPPPPVDKIVVSIQYSPEKVDVGTIVNLDGSKTKASSSNAVITEWEWIVRNEGGMHYPVKGEATPLASFTCPDLNWLYVVLNVKDSNGKVGMRSIKIDIGQPQPSNKPPFALAGDDQTVSPNSIVTLNASQSYDPDGDPITYQWNQTSGKQVTLQNPTQAITTFVAPSLDVVPPPPSATLKAPATVAANTSVILDGSESSGDTLNITQTGGPAVMLQDAGHFKKSFISPNEATTLSFQAIAIRGGQQAMDSVTIQVTKDVPPPPPPPPPPPDVTYDANGLAWLVGKGEQTMIKQSRDESTDDRWSGNVKGLSRGFEATMIAKSIGTNSSSHFAMKMFGGNHSGSGASSQRWYDLGLRVSGLIQLQWEGPHPSNHNFTLPAKCQFIKQISKGLEGNWLGLKWSCIKLKEGGSPANGGIRVRMWVDEDPLDSNGKPKNNWKLVCDFIDGIDVKVIDPQSYQAPDEQDCEVRRSDTKNHEIFAGGLHVRKLGFIPTAADSRPTTKEGGHHGIMKALGRGRIKEHKETDEVVGKECIPTREDCIIPEHMQEKIEKLVGDMAAKYGQPEAPLPETPQAAAPTAATPIDLVFKLTVTDSKGASASDDIKVTVSEGQPPPPADPVAQLYGPSTAAAGSTVVIDASGSKNYDNLTITQTVGEQVQLQDIGNNKRQFICPMSAGSNFTLGFRAIATKGTKQSVADISIQVHTVPPPPPPPPPTSFKIGHIGDTHGRTKGVTGFKELKQKQNCEFILHSGDVTDDEDDAQHFVNLVKEVGLTYGQNFAESQGNHSSPEESGQGAQQDLENAFPILKQTKWLQFYHHKNVVIIINNTQLPNYSQLSSESSKHMQSSLVKAKQLVDSGAADWIFIMQHKPMYVIRNDGHEPEYNFRYVFHPLIDQYGGDFFLSGHCHLAHRTLPLIFGGSGTNVPPKVNSAMKGDAHDFTVSPHGIICAHNGSSSKQHNLDEKTNPWTGYAQDNIDAYTVFEIAGKTVKGQYIEIGTGKVLHEFKVTKEGSVGPPPPPPPPPPPVEGEDPFGIKKIYATNPNGAPEFYLGVGDSNNNRLEHNGTISGAGKDTTIKVTSDAARIWVHTDPSKQAINQLNHQNYAQNQFMLNSKDWKNCEITAAVKLNKIGGTGNPAFKWGLRGGRLERDAPLGCQGTRYRTHIEFTGNTLLRKDTRSHGDNREFNREGGQNVGNLLGKGWVIIKFVTYNLPDGSSVKIEVYFDGTGQGKNFTKIQETVDSSGGWGQGATDCGGTSGQVITWGSPMALFRWDGSTDTDLKWLSVREIAAGGAPPPPPPPPDNTAFTFNVSGDFRDTPESGDNLISDKPDLILSTGDYGIAQAPADWLNKVMKQWRDSGIETWGALGNHDNAKDYLALGFFKNTSWSWAKKKGSVCFVAANTISENVAETDQLLQQAQADPEVKTIIVLMHEGIYHPPNTSVSSDTTIEFHNSFKKYSKVRAVICGHTHVYGRMKPIDNILYIMNGIGGQSPSSGSTAPSANHKINGALHCSVNKDGSITCNCVPNAGDAPNIMDTFTIGANGELPQDGVIGERRD